MKKKSREITRARCLKPGMIIDAGDGCTLQVDKVYILMSRVRIRFTDGTHIIVEKGSKIAFFPRNLVRKRTGKR